MESAMLENKILVGNDTRDMYVTYISKKAAE